MGRPGAQKPEQGQGQKKRAGEGAGRPRLRAEDGNACCELAEGTAGSHSPAPLSFSEARNCLAEWAGNWAMVFQLCFSHHSRQNESGALSLFKDATWDLVPAPPSSQSQNGCTGPDVTSVFRAGGRGKGRRRSPLSLFLFSWIKESFLCSLIEHSNFLRSH